MVQPFPRPHLTLATGLFLAVTILVTTPARGQDPTNRGNWAQWRGPLGTGVAPEANPPVEWSETKNIRWRAEVPGLGHSTPIVWDQTVFLTTSIPFGEELPPRYSGTAGAHDNLPVTRRHRFVVMALDRRNGDVLWQKTVREALPHEGGHYSGSLASASPVTDGQHVYAFFGSYGLYCFDLEGERIWERDFGRMNSKHGHGEGSSPALYGDLLVVNWDHEGDSFVVALDKRTGQVRWKADRQEVTSWATPIIVQHEGRPQVIVCGTARVRNYDLATGETIWSCGGLSANIVATPVASDGMVFVASSYDTRNMLAIRLGGEGDITNSEHVVWSRRERTPYVPSLLLYGDSLYFLRHYQGILSRVDAATGEERVGPFRLGAIRNVYASPVAAAGRVYITGLEGATQVISHGEVPRALAVNRLDDRFSASAAVVDDSILLRGEKFLYCIAEPRSSSTP